MFLFLPCQLPIFALGILFYFIIKDNYNLKISPILIVLSSVIMLSQFSGIRILPGHFLFGTAFVILGIALSKYEFKVLVNPVIVHIGKISYSMYLVHFAILYWLDKINFVNYLMVTNYFSGLLNYGIRLLLLLGITTVISTVFYRFVELPMQMLGRKLIVKLNK